MSILLAAVYLLFDAARSCVVFHAGTGHPRRVDPTPESPRLVKPTVADLARAAEREAIAQLLTTRPGTVRRVVVH